MTLRPGWLATLWLLGCSTEPLRMVPRDATVADVAKPDAAPEAAAPDVPAPPPDVEPPCPDTDRDGLSDVVEGAPSQDTDGDGTPDYRDTDSDDDGFFDQNESRRAYRGGVETGLPPFACGGVGDNCETGGMDTTPNHRDRDSDDDGLTDREERMLGTDPCNPDTDGDTVGDVVEAAAMSDPRDPVSRPSSNTLYVVLPYHAPGSPGVRERREFTFATRIRRADVFLLVDNSLSMGAVINNVRTNFSAVIVPALQTAVSDVRVGVGSFVSMPDGVDGDPGMPGDYTLWVRQPLTADLAAAQRALDAMRTIDRDAPGFQGGDFPENATEAAYEVVAGTGSRGHETDPAALRSVTAATDPRGNGWVPAMDPMRDCAADPDDPEGVYGWGCFRRGRVPIVVLVSDAGWYDGCLADSPRSPGTPSTGHTCDELVAAYNRRAAYFIGIDVGTAAGDDETFRNSQLVAMRTSTLDGRGTPIAFSRTGGISSVSSNVTGAITEIAVRARQNVTTRVRPDPVAEGVPMGRSTADFIDAVTPARGDPEAPAGYDRRDMTTFYNVDPSTRVTFTVDFDNDFLPGAATARLYRATIEVLGRGETVVDTRQVFVVVPAPGGGVTPQ